MLHLYRKLSKESNETKKKLDAMRSAIGKNIMYKIIYESTNRRPSMAETISQLNSKCAEYSDAPLLELKVGDQEYNMILDRYDKYVVGEYRTYEDIIRSGELPQDFEEIMETIDIIVMENSISIYNCLPTDIKKTNNEFSKVLRSKNKRYLYYYKDNQKKSFGILFVERNL
jgi:hypothetical protein